MHIDGAALRPVLSRQVTLRGPKFYRSGEDREIVLFVNYLDGSTREGPREAMETDAVGHPAAYQKFLDEEAGQPPETPLRPLLTFKDPPGGLPPREKGHHERRRDQAAERGEG